MRQHSENWLGINALTMCYLISKARYQEVTARLQRSVEKAGRSLQDVTVSALIPTFLSDDLAAARAAACRFLRFYLTVPVYQNMLRRSGFVDEIDGVAQALASRKPDEGDAFITDRLMDEVCLVGPQSRCNERLAELAEAGVTYPVVAPQVVQGEPAAEVRYFLETFNGWRHGMSQTLLSPQGDCHEFAHECAESGSVSAVASHRHGPLARGLRLRDLLVCRRALLS